MKAKFYLKFNLILIIILGSFLHASAGTQIKEVFANNNFNISRSQDLITVDICKNPWESFTISVNSLDLQQNPVVNLEFRCSEPIELRVDLTDGINMSTRHGILKKEISLVNNFTPVSFDFSDMIGDLDLSGDVYFLFYVNPGEAFKGEITVRNFSLNRNSVENTNTSVEKGFTMFPSPASTYTNIEIPDGDYQSLALMDMNGQEVMHEDISFLNGSIFRANLQNLKRGYYVVRLSGASQQLTEKLIIN